MRTSWIVAGAVVVSVLCLVVAAIALAVML